jgi:glycosyltransferase involved in cell wall biosynthesis
VISIVVISKDEPELDATLDGIRGQVADLGRASETIVVDASSGRLDAIRERHPEVRWFDYERPEGVRVSIPHQRNFGVRRASGQTIVFTDAGCVPRPGWLAALIDPLLRGDEQVVAGVAPSPNARAGVYDGHIAAVAREDYVSEAPTINLAFARSAFDRVGGFDEAFEYGSDIDFSWRLRDAGYRIRMAASAAVEHDWGDPGRQLKRSYAYGRARARLYLKHRRRLRGAWRSDPIVLAYPLFLVGLPLTLRFPAYPLLLALPAWRNRNEGSVRTVADHLVFGTGVLAALARR